MEIIKNIAFIMILCLMVFSCKITKNEAIKKLNNDKIEKVPNSNLNIHSEEKLNKSIIIKNYDISLIKRLVKEICIRWNMIDKSTTILYPNQELLYLLMTKDEANYFDIDRSQYIVIYINNNVINIFVHDYLANRSKWYDNFTLDIINTLNNNEINYEEKTYK
jgi:hypothetical protein